MLIQAGYGPTRKKFKSKTIGGRIKSARIAKSQKIYNDLKSAGQRIAFSETTKNIFHQGALAKASGISQARISEWERDIIEPKISSLRKLAKVLGVSLFDLIPEKVK